MDRLKFALELREGLIQESVMFRPKMMSKSGFSEDIGAPSNRRQSVGRTQVKGVSSTSNRTRKFKVIQVSSKNVFAEFVRILHGLNKQITPR